MAFAAPYLASLFATAGTTAAASAGEAALVAGATAATTTAATAGEAALLAGVAGATAPTTAAATGLSAGTIASLAGTGASLAGTGAQLLAGKPELPTLPGAPTRDDARAEADRESELLKRRGRAAALLTAGGARGDTSKPSLGAAALLGA